MGAAMNVILLKTVFRAVIKRAARAALVGRSRDRERHEAGRFTRTEVDEILQQSWQRYGELAPSVPRQPKLGNRMNVLLSCLTLACFEVLMSRGTAREYAIELIGDVTWKVYETWGGAARKLTWLVSRDPRRRLELSLGMFLRFPFTPPGYRFERSSSPDGIAVDMFRCPVAEYFREYGASDLCVGTWCNLDFALAELWHGRLQRTETLASGGLRCDFRFKVDSTPKRPGVTT